LVIQVVLRVDRDIVLQNIQRIFRLFIRRRACRCGIHPVRSFSTKGEKILKFTFVPFDNHICHTISQRRRGTSITLLHPSGQLDVCLLTRVVRLRQRLRDHKLRHIDLVLQKVGNDLFCVAGSAKTSERLRGGGESVGEAAHAWASSTFLSINILCRHVSITAETSRQLSRRTVYQR
jgi:hypothetical protein